MLNAFLAGTRVAARGLLWEIVHVEPAGEVEHRFRLRCVEGDLRGEELDLLHPFDFEPFPTPEFTKHALAKQGNP